MNRGDKVPLNISEIPVELAEKINRIILEESNLRKKYEDFESISEDARLNYLSKLLGSADIDELANNEDPNLEEFLLNDLETAMTHREKEMQFSENESERMLSDPILNENYKEEKSKINTLKIAVGSNFKQYIDTLNVNLNC